ncbi:MAG: hypothetical protein AVDCRST_MAG52-2234, partial [uncultured Blastococcus sp.]
AARPRQRPDGSAGRCRRPYLLDPSAAHRARRGGGADRGGVAGGQLPRGRAARLARL